LNPSKLGALSEGIGLITLVIFFPSKSFLKKGKVKMRLNEIGEIKWVILELRFPRSFFEGFQKQRGFSMMIEHALSSGIILLNYQVVSMPYGGIA